MTGYRITIRNIDPDVADAVRDIAYEQDRTLGECVTEALSEWCARQRGDAGESDPAAADIERVEAILEQQVWFTNQLVKLFTEPATRVGDL